MSLLIPQIKALNTSVMDDEFTLATNTTCLEFTEIQQHTEATRILELGFGGGHMSYILLSLFPDSTIHTVDRMNYTYSLPNIAILQELFPDRLTYTHGDVQIIWNDYYSRCGKEEVRDSDGTVVSTIYTSGDVFTTEYDMVILDTNLDNLFQRDLAETMRSGVEFILVNNYMSEEVYTFVNAKCSSPSSKYDIVDNWQTDSQYKDEAKKNNLVLLKIKPEERVPRVQII